MVQETYINLFNRDSDYAHLPYFRMQYQRMENDLLLCHVGENNKVIKKIPRRDISNLHLLVANPLDHKKKKKTTTTLKYLKVASRKTVPKPRFWITKSSNANGIWTTWQTFWTNPEAQWSPCKPSTHTEQVGRNGENPTWPTKHGSWKFGRSSRIYQTSVCYSRVSSSIHSFLIFIVVCFPFGLQNKTSQHLSTLEENRKTWSFFLQNLMFFEIHLRNSLWDLSMWQIRFDLHPMENPLGIPKSYRPNGGLFQPSKCGPSLSGLIKLLVEVCVKAHTLGSKMWLHHWGGVGKAMILL